MAAPIIRLALLFRRLLTEKRKTASPSEVTECGRRQKMKKTVTGLTALLALAAAMIDSRASESAMLYVSTHGRDSWTGKTAQPNEAGTDEPLPPSNVPATGFRRMKKAGDQVVRQGVIVEILGGKYELSRPVELTGEDAGTTTSPVTYRARAGDEVCISGGRAISGSTPVTDPVVLRAVSIRRPERRCSRPG